MKSNLDKVNKVRNGISKVLYCDSTLEGCSDCPYTKDCAPTEMISVPRNMLLDAGQVLSYYWETLQPGYKTNAEIELEKVVSEYKECFSRYSRKTYVATNAEHYCICDGCNNRLSDDTYIFCPHCGARFV